MNLFLKFSAFILILALIYTCKKDQGTNPSNDYMTYTEGSGSIGPGGGIISLNDQSSLNGLLIGIPQGALSDAVSISMKVDNSVRPLGAGAVDIVDLKPDGQIFNKTVSMQIPVSSSIQNPRLYYYNPASDLVSEVPLTKNDRSQGFLVAQINHFSKYFVMGKSIGMNDVSMYNTGTTIKAKVKIGDASGLAAIPVNALNYITSLGTITTAKQFIDNAIPVTNSGTVQVPEQCYGTLKVDLMEGGWINDKSLSSVKLAVRRKGLDPKTSSWAVVSMVSPTEKTLFTSSSLNAQKKEDFFTGKALVFNFNIKPENGKEYYLRFSWCLSSTPDGYLLGGRFTNVYEFNTDGNYPAWTSSNMLTTDPDKNNNNIDDIYDGLANQAPSIPAVTGPANNATGISTTPVLSWTCTDPDGDALTYDVYFGTTSTPTTIVATDQIAATLSRTGLMVSTKYYWKVVSKDPKGLTASSAVWNFTTGTTVNTPPAAPSSPSPASGSVNQAVTLALSWTCSDPNGDALTYDIYFGTTSTPTTAISTNQSAKTVAVTGLAGNTKYYWNVVAKDNKGASISGDIWNFTTIVTPNNPPAAPSVPSPANLATGQSLTPTLSWLCSDPNGDALTYDVYFGTASTPTVTIATGQSEKTISRTGLTANTTYYWKIVAKDSKGATTSGPIWSFTTLVPSVPVLTLFAASAITTTSAFIEGVVTSGGGSAVTEYGIYYGTSSNPKTTGTKIALGSGTVAFSKTLTNLTANVRYYVMAYAINSLGTGYSTEINFMTSVVTPVISLVSATATNVTCTGTLCYGNITIRVQVSNYQGISGIYSSPYLPLTSSSYGTYTFSSTNAAFVKDIIPPTTDFTIYIDVQGSPFSSLNVNVY